MTKAEAAGYPATGVVLNPTDLQNAQLAKPASGDGHFLFPPTTTSPWGVPTVSTIAMPKDRAAVGAFALAAEIFDREQSNIRISEHHNDIFLRNQVIILGEERVTLANYRPAAVVDVDLTP